MIKLVSNARFAFLLERKLIPKLTPKATAPKMIRLLTIARSLILMVMKLHPD
ncbi:hypothetical protein ABN584_12155 [Gloeocapsa sp. BRSZ]